MATMERVAEVLGGRVWAKGGHVRVYWGHGKAESCLTVGEDGALSVSCGRGVTLGDVETRLHAAGLATGTARETGYGSTVLDDVRIVDVVDEDPDAAR